MKTWKIVGGIALVALIAVGTVVWFAFHEDTSVPVIEVPKLKMPSPNAFDYFVKAGKQLNVPRDFTEMEGKGAYSGPQRDQILKNNQQALETLRRGVGYHYLHPLAYRFDHLYPEYARFRTLARLLRAEGQARAGREDWPGAISSYLDGMLMSELVPHGGGYMGSLVGMSIRGVSRKNAWETIDHLTAAQARAATARLESISGHNLPLDKTLEEEKIRGLLSLQDNFSGKCKAPEVKYFPQLPDRIKRKVLVGYAEYMDDCIRTVRMPYASKPPIPTARRWRCTDPLVFAKEGPVYIILGLYCAFPCDMLWFDDANSETQNRLLAAALALRAYRVERGSYPGKLADLVPSYLRSLPDDPFAGKGSFGYRREGEKYVLWSVGPDCKDDHGKPIVKPRVLRPNNYGWEEHSKGDIVAGVNDK